MEVGINVLLVMVSIFLLVLSGVIVIFAVRVLYHLDRSQQVLREMSLQHVQSQERLVTSIRADLVTLQQHSQERLQSVSIAPPPPPRNEHGPSVMEMQAPLDPTGGLDFAGN